MAALVNCGITKANMWHLKRFLSSFFHSGNIRLLLLTDTPQYKQQSSGPTPVGGMVSLQLNHLASCSLRLKNKTLCAQWNKLNIVLLKWRKLSSCAVSMTQVPLFPGLNGESMHAGRRGSLPQVLTLCRMCLLVFRCSLTTNRMGNSAKTKLS